MATRSRNLDGLARARDFFARLAKEGAWSRVFVITGEERHLVDRAVKGLIASVFPSGRDDFNLQIWRAGEARGADIVLACQTLPMFASARVCVLRGADEAAAAELAPLAAYAGQPEPSTLLIIEAVKLNATLKAVKELLGRPEVVAVEFAPLTPTDATTWVQERTVERGLRVDRDAAALLVETVGTSLGVLDQALERLSLFAADTGRPIGVAEVEEVVPDTRGRTIFELLDHVAARRLDLAVAGYRRLSEQGESPVGAVVMVASHLRRLVRTRQALREGATSRELPSALGVPAFLAQRYERQAGRFTDRELRDALRQALRADRTLKSSRLPDDLVVEQMLMGICGTAAAR